LLQTDRDAGLRFMLAYLEAVSHYNRGKTRRNLDVLETRIGQDRAALVDACWIPLRNDARIDVQSLVEFLTWARSRGLLERELAPEEFWEPRFIEGALEERGRLGEAGGR
jgi:hypothetical protein